MGATGTGRRAEVLADPDDERRRPSEQPGPRPGEDFADFLRRRAGEGAQFGTDERDTQIRRRSRQPTYKWMEDDWHTNDWGGAGEDAFSREMTDGRFPSGFRRKAGAGDALMGRIYGDRNASSRPPVQEHRLTIEVPPGVKAKPAMGDMFRDVQVSKRTQMDGADI